MKLLSLVLMLSSPAAFACQHTQAQFVCPGDTVYDESNSQGTVTAINPFQHTASYAIYGVGTYSAQIPTLSLAVGCLEAVCVGDKIYDESNSQGTAVAVNPFTNSITYSIYGVGTYSAQVNTLKVAYGCALGYCVGDQIVDESNSNGTIVAISPYDANAAYSIYGVGTYSAEIQTLGNTKYCAQYSDSHPARRAKHYPSIPSARYAAPTFHYYPTRK
jgi:hypothetical protein